jgi:hypothetical protein
MSCARVIKGQSWQVRIPLRQRYASPKPRALVVLASSNWCVKGIRVQEIVCTHTPDCNKPSILAVCLHSNDRQHLLRSGNATTITTIAPAIPSYQFYYAVQSWLWMCQQDAEWWASGYCSRLHFRCTMRDVHLIISAACTCWWVKGCLLAWHARACRRHASRTILQAERYYCHPWSRSSTLLLKYKCAQSFLKGVLEPSCVWSMNLLPAI